MEKKKPPVFGMIQRSGQVVIRMLANVRKVTIEPLYLGFFEFVHNVGKRGKALFHSLIELLVK